MAHIVTCVRASNAGWLSGRELAAHRLHASLEDLLSRGSGHLPAFPRCASPAVLPIVFQELVGHHWNQWLADLNNTGTSADAVAQAAFPGSMHGGSSQLCPRQPLPLVLHIVEVRILAT